MLTSVMRCVENGRFAAIRARLLTALCLALITMCLIPVTPARALDTSTRTVDQIRQRWLDLRPTFSGTPYLEPPTVWAPYAVGSLHAGFIRDGLDAVNYARYLAGLPDDVVLDPDLERPGAAWRGARGGQRVLPHAEPAAGHGRRFLPAGLPRPPAPATSAGATRTSRASTSAAWTTATPQHPVARPPPLAALPGAGQDRHGVSRVRRRGSRPTPTCSTGAGRSPSTTRRSSGRAPATSPSSSSRRTPPGRSR